MRRSAVVLSESVFVESWSVFAEGSPPAQSQSLFDRLSARDLMRSKQRSRDRAFKAACVFLHIFLLLSVVKARRPLVIALKQ